jgi:hypothetical protein
MVLIGVGVGIMVLAGTVVGITDGIIGTETDGTIPIIILQMAEEM